METRATHPGQLMQSFLLVAAATLAVAVIFAARWLPVDDIKAFHVGNTFLISSFPLACLGLNALGCFLGMSKPGESRPVHPGWLLALFAASMAIVGVGAEVMRDQVGRFYLLEGALWYSNGAVLVWSVAGGRAARSLRRIADSSLPGLSRAASLGMWILCALMAAMAVGLLWQAIEHGTLEKGLPDIACFVLGGLAGLHPLVPISVRRR